MSPIIDQAVFGSGCRFTNRTSAHQHGNDIVDNLVVNEVGPSVPITIRPDKFPGSHKVLEQAQPALLPFNRPVSTTLDHAHFDLESIVFSPLDPVLQGDFFSCHLRGSNI